MASTASQFSKYLIFSDRNPKAEPPSFLKKIGDTEVYEGMKARFTACATGYPGEKNKRNFFLSRN